MIKKVNQQNQTTNSCPAATEDKPSVIRPKVIILGASNVARGISSVIQTSQLIFGRPMDLYLAIGHGRSYGQWSKVLGRTLPGINECAIWNALADSDNHNNTDTQAPGYALITDIGNDIPYGADVQQILDWIKNCVNKLQNEHNVKNIIITSLPMDSLSTLTKKKFNIIRAILFPKSPVTFETAMKNSNDLNNELIHYAANENTDISFVPLPGKWYGFDPIHIRIKHWKQAWPIILSGWLPLTPTLPQTGNNPTAIKPKYKPVNWLYLRTLIPYYRRIFGIEQKQTQPSGRLKDGSTISLF